MLFLVIKEFEPQEPDAYFNNPVVDNTVYICLHPISRDFDIYVNRKDTKKAKFVPYKVSVSSVKQVVSFLHFIFFGDSLIQTDMYHCEGCIVEDEKKNAAEQIGILSNYENEKYSVVGFNRDSTRDKSLRLIKQAVKILRARR
jgi:hypothetical protein